MKTMLYVTLKLLLVFYSLVVLLEPLGVNLIWCIVSDTSEFDALERNSSNEEDMNTPQNANQSGYGTAIAIALVVLIIALLAQYFIWFKKLHVFPF